MADSAFNWKSLAYYWNILNQIRNTDSNKEGNSNDFIQSPVEPFFDSRKVTDKQLPENGDANGAYNIARKGAMLLERIKKVGMTNPNFEYIKDKSSVDFLIRDNEWDTFITSK